MRISYWGSDVCLSHLLAEAERARAAADETEEAYRAKTEVSRAEALKVTQAAKDASARETEQKVKAADAETAEKVAAAEARIREAADAAMSDITTVAAHTAQDMVASLCGITVPKAQATQAVNAERQGQVGAIGRDETHRAPNT